MPPVDPPSARMRSEGSAPRRRSSDPPIRRRQDDHKPGNGIFGALFTIVVAVLFLGYVFNIGGFARAADEFFNGLNGSAQSQSDTVARVVAVAYPAFGLLVAALFVFFVLRVLFNGLRRSSKNRKLAKRMVITLEAFKRITAERGIRPRIATQAYELLLPFYSSSMRARLDDRLIEDLQMTPAQVQDVYANLLRNTDRKAAVGETQAIYSIMDLLNAVQNAKRQSLMDSVVHPAAGSKPVPAKRADGADLIRR